MNDYNYDDFYAFYGKNEEKPEGEDSYESFLDYLKKGFDSKDFTENVLGYLESEWMIVLAEQPFIVQKKAMDCLDKLKNRGEKVQNIAGKIARKIKGA